METRQEELISKLEKSAFRSGYLRALQDVTDTLENIGNTPMDGRKLESYLISWLRTKVALLSNESKKAQLAFDIAKGLNTGR